MPRAPLAALLVLASLGAALGALWWWSRPEIIVLSLPGEADGGAPRTGISFASEAPPEVSIDAGVRGLVGRVTFGDETTPAPGAKIEVYRESSSVLRSARCNACDQGAFECAHHSTVRALWAHALEGGGRQKPIAERVADASGRFVLDDLPVGAPLVLVATSGGGAGTAQWEAPSPDAEVADEVLSIVVLAPVERTLLVDVFDGEAGGGNRPLAGADVLIWNLDTFEVISTRTNASGQVTSRMAPGGIWVAANASGFVPQGQFWSGAVTELTLQPAHTLVVHTQSGGAPLDAEVTVEGLHPATARSVGGIAHFLVVGGDETGVQARAGGLIARLSELPLFDHDETHVLLELKQSARLLVSLVDEKGAPVPAARLSLWQAGAESASQVSGENGELVVLGPVSEGDAELSVDVAEFRHDERHLVLAPGDTALELTLHPTMALHGRVVDSAGAPAPRTQLTAHLKTGGLFAETTDYSDAEGAFDLRVEDSGPWVLEVVGPKGRAALEVAAPALNLEVRLDLQATLEVAVVDEAGHALKGAAVQVLERATGTLVPNYAEEDGVFRSTGLEEGRYEVAATCQGYARGQADVAVADHRASATRLVLKAGAAIEGRVLTVSGKPIAGLLVVIDEELSGARTDEEGAFVLEDLTAGHAYSLQVESEAAVEPRQRLKAPARGVVFHVADPRIVRGRVVDETGRPLPAFTVDDTTVEASDGRFEVPVMSGKVTISADERGWVELPLPKGNDLGDVVLRKPPELTGLVLEPDGRPAVGATVVSELSDAVSPTTTGADGRFRTRLTIAVEALQLSAKKGSAVGVADVRPGDANIVVRLADPVRVHGAVYGPEGRPAAGVVVQYVKVSTGDQGRQESGPDGRFELRLSAGRYTFSTRIHQASQVVELGGVDQDLVIGRAGSSCSIELQANRVLEFAGLVPAGGWGDASGGADGGGADYLDVSILPAGSIVLPVGYRAAAVHADGLPCGDYVILVRGGGATAFRPVSLRVGDSQPVQFVLAEAGAP